MSPSADLPMVDILQARLEVSSLHLRGVATRWDEPEAGALDLVIDLPLSSPLTAALDLSINRDIDPLLSLNLDLIIDGTLLDDLALEALATDGVWSVEDADRTTPGVDVLLDNLSKQTPSAEIQTQR